MNNFTSPILPFSSSATAYIDVQAYQYNLQKLNQYAPNSQMMAIVKANAYGHGMLDMARYAKPADMLGVARLEEAVILRQSGVTCPILLLEGIFRAEHIEHLIGYQLQTVIHNEEQLKMLEDFPLAKHIPPIVVWLKVDTGMHRLGVPLIKVDEFLLRLRSCNTVNKDIRFMSHFACADDKESTQTQMQIDRFNQVTSSYALCSIAASAAILSCPNSHYDWVRAGIISYGISPFSDKTAAELGFKPVMNLKSHLIAVRDLPANEPIGYGGTWQSSVPTRIGVIAFGYGDGYPRNVPEGTPVFINGRKVPIVGRVSMDMIMVDLGVQSQDKINDEVLLWGDELPVEEVATHLGTIGYELVTRLTSRVSLKYQL